MKYNIIYILLFTCLCSNVCLAQKKVQPEFPAEMLPHVKKEYAKQFDKGHVLYTINCASCHNKKLKGKEILPNFTIDQLNGYELRVLNPKHESEIPETTVTEEELGLIMVFLKYKKKSKE